MTTGVINGAITLQHTSLMIDPGPAASVTLSNVIREVGESRLAKLGTNTLVLTGANTITGVVIVYRGVLEIGQGGSVTAPINVFTDATLRGVGSTTDEVFVIPGGVFAPGSATGAGAFTSNSLNLQPNATFQEVLSGASSYGTANVAGQVTLVGGLNLTVTPGASLPVGTMFVLIHETGTAAISGTFSNAAQGASITAGGYTFTISYTGGTGGNDVVLTETAAPAFTVTNSSFNQAITDQGTAAPLAGLSVNDGANTRTETAAITYAAANGALTGAGLTGSPGSQTLTASSAAQLQSMLRALTFTPTANQIQPGRTVDTAFSVTVTNAGGSAVASDTVTTTSVNDAPVIAGTHASTTSDTTSVTPFSAVTLIDPDVQQRETATVTLSSAADGVLSGTGLTAGATPGTYTASGTTAQVQAALRGASFTPAMSAVAGPSTTTTFSLSLNDGTVASGSDTATVVTTTHAGPQGDQGATVPAGTTTRVSTPQTYTGKTQISGELDLASGGSIALSSQVALKASGAVFDVSGAGAGGATVTIQELSGVAGSTIKLGAGVLSLTESVAATYAGAITNGGVAGGTGGGLVVNGSAALTLTGVDSYSGKTQIYGQLDLAGSAVLNQSRAVTLKAPGAVFDISGATGKEAILNFAGVAGSHVYLGGNTLKINDSTSATFSGVISDGGAAGGTGGGLIVKGTASLNLTGANTFTGGVTLQTGVLELGTPTAAGVGHALTFAGAATLQLDAGALTGSGAARSYGTTIAGFATNDHIDLTSLAYAAGATASYSGSTLTVSSGGSSVALTLSGLAAGTGFSVTDDGHGHALVGLVGGG